MAARGEEQAFLVIYLFYGGDFLVSMAEISIYRRREKI